MPEVNNSFAVSSDLLLVQDKNYKNKLLLWLKKLGFWGFMFFLVKGLVWLAVMYWIAK